MAKYFLILCVIAFATGTIADRSASDLASEMYDSCLSQLSVSCVRPKALRWINEVVGQNKIRITEDLSIIRTADDEELPQEQRSNDASSSLFDKIENFLATHSLKIEVPQILKMEEARSMIPEMFLKGGLSNGLVVPLSDQAPAEGRGFIKKVIVPFVLGLKFKASVMLPLALALIALKTWKAMTLGLLSLVLSGALVIFKVTKPKIVNYEVIHYPHHHHVEHHIDHPPHHHHIEYGPPGWARNFDAQNLAYAGQQ